ncbi:hypothetical protein SAMN04488067_11167 [Halorubrum xinjiangense]|uniref:Uncharacterized protein n=1 Tax=Halorubrum xinjiangense TaxID=261291 RepID=A0A1G7Q783_9EURY|nr:hypothetical protein SAMN04488067_11167 [Halorubrum xinjiangense]
MTSILDVETLLVSEFYCVAVIAKCFNKLIPTLDCELMERVSGAICRIQL